MTRPANPSLRDASDRQLLGEVKRREHISTNTLVRALLSRFDAAIMVGVQLTASNRTEFFHDAHGEENDNAYAHLCDFVHGWVDNPAGEATEPDDPPATDGEVAEDEE